MIKRKLGGWICTTTKKKVLFFRKVVIKPAVLLLIPKHPICKHTSVFPTRESWGRRFIWVCKLETCQATEYISVLVYLLKWTPCLIFILKCFQLQINNKRQKPKSCIRFVFSASEHSCQNKTKFNQTENNFSSQHFSFFAWQFLIFWPRVYKSQQISLLFNLHF